MILSGYHPVPFRRLYWSNQADVYNHLVAESMRRNRFEEIIKYLHFADNSKITADRYYKIRPLFKEINKCFKIISLSPDITIDETMIKYYGKHSSKQFIRGKPVRFGFKMFSLASLTGYLHHVEPYCGADTQLNVVLSLAQACDVPIGSRVYFDNWFTSLPLLDRLKAKGVGGTGTIRADRCENAPLLTKSELEKLGRGAMSCSFDGNNMLVRWCDNAIVSVASNCQITNTCKSVSRWSKKQKKRVDVPMPEIIHSYNRCMGGVDLFDQFVANYRIRIRSKKWWWVFFSWSIDACIVNSWIIFKSVKRSSISLLEFRREVLQQLLKQCGTPRIKTGPKIPYNPNAATAIRFDKVDHWPAALPSRYSRCRECGDRSSTKCEKCDAPLHVQCFKKYHEN